MNFALFVPKFILNCVTGLTVLALLLATIGLYGAISYSVSERRKELGIRVALGAMPPQLFQLVLRRTLAIAGIGVALGLGLGVAASSLAMSTLYGIHPVEWDVLVPVAGCMLAVAAAIAYLAARPWIRMDAMDAVRHA
jgi:ABC-type antimicrobial peptide transport system permease subunit